MRGVALTAGIAIYLASIVFMGGLLLISGASLLL